MCRLLSLWLVLGFALGDVLAYPPEGGGRGEAVAAIEAEVSVEEQLLAEALTRYRSLSSRRGALLGRIVELYAELDRSVGLTAEGAQRQLRQLLFQIDVAEGERNRMQVTERTLIHALETHARRITLLVERIADLEGERDEAAGALSGDWDVVLLPLQQRGTFSLRQSGTLVSGTYELAGGWTGSVQGTLVKRKVFLVRIDSELGKSMELEGFLSIDGSKIKGTWLNYALSGGEGSTGEWSATKR